MFSISILELVGCLSEVIDLMSEDIRDHHKKVACGAFQLATACGIQGEHKRDIVIAAALHDIGGLSLEARKNAVLHFEDTNSHAEKGYKLLQRFQPFSEVSRIVRYHHAHWQFGTARELDGRSLNMGSQIVLLADRIAVLLQPGIQTLIDKENIISRLSRQVGSTFAPELIEHFREAAEADIFWLNITSSDYHDTIIEHLKEDDIILSGEYTDDLLTLLSNLTDFRSAFTAMHSKGVSIVAENLAKLMGLSQNECYAIRVAALLHDIGKLAIPSEIIDKHGPLTPYERSIIRTHSYYTGRVLSRLSGFETVLQYAALHHENLDGTGYPNGRNAENLCLGARIMKVADVFMALREDRPYRAGMSREQAADILQTMVQKQQMDATIVDVLSENIEAIEEACYKAELIAAEQYRQFLGTDHH